MTTSLEGKVSIVTGAGRGIGKAIALHFAQAGSKLVLAARSTEELEETAREVEALGASALVSTTDISDSNQVDLTVQRTLEKFGRIDHLINNSGLTGPSAPMHEIDIDSWNETLAVNLTGPFLMTKAVLPHMITERRGTIVYIGSVSGKRPLANRTPYAASKLGLVGLVRTLAMEVGQYGVRANLVSPGAVEGERIDWVIEQQSKARGISRREVIDEATSTAALRRFVRPTEIAHTVAFLASEASEGITGEDINVSAGLVMH